MPKRHDLTDITVIFVKETEKALGVRKTEDSSFVIWLPKSQIEFSTEGSGPHVLKTGYVEVTLPEWLAQEKGLI